MNVAELAPTVDKKPQGWGAEQLFITGQKGTGKSQLERRIIDTLPASELVIVIDSKRDWPYKKGLSVLRRFGFLARRSSQEWVYLPHTDLRLVPPGRYVYRPKYPEVADAGAHKIFLTALKLKALRKQSCTIVIDELGDFSTGSQPIRSLGKLIREGRSMWVRLIIGCQRPAAVPLLAVQEATKVIAFHLQNIDDRRRLAQWVDPAYQDNPAGWHDFTYKNVRARELRHISQPAKPAHGARGAA